MSEKQKSAEDIKSYISLKSAFTDYTRFEGDAEQRAAQRSAFLGDFEYVPLYDYDKLTFLIDDEIVRDKKTSIQQAVLELEAAKDNPENDPLELELYRRFHEMRLKKIMLVESARDLLRPFGSLGQESARESFMQMNNEVYGDFNHEVYMGMLSSEASMIGKFQPGNRLARVIQSELQNVFDRMPLGGCVENEILDNLTLDKLKQFIHKKYGAILSVVPDTDDSHYYDADECAAIMNDALFAGNLSQKGWTVIVDPMKSNPSTGNKYIRLPVSTRRTAAELRRLILHEQEVHARRAQNGADSGLSLLAGGTADYADVEEGLGVMLEIAVEGSLDNPSFHRARDRYITTGLVLGSDSAPRDAREVFEIVWRLLAVRNATQGGEIYDEIVRKAKDLAYSHIENAFRGTLFYQKGVAYTKLKVYYEGLAKNANYFAEAIESGTIEQALEIAMEGKMNHTDPDEVALIQEIITHNSLNQQEVTS